MNGKISGFLILINLEQWSEIRLKSKVGRVGREDTWEVWKLAIKCNETIAMDWQTSHAPSATDSWRNAVNTICIHFSWVVCIFIEMQENKQEPTVITWHGLARESGCIFSFLHTMTRFTLLVLSACACECVHVCRCSWQLEVDFGFPGAGTTGTCGMPRVGAGNHTRVFCKNSLFP